MTVCCLVIASSVERVHALSEPFDMGEEQSFAFQRSMSPSKMMMMMINQCVNIVEINRRMALHRFRSYGLFRWHHRRLTSNLG